MKYLRSSSFIICFNDGFIFLLFVIAINVFIFLLFFTFDINVYIIYKTS